MLDFKVDFALLLYDEFDGSAISDSNVVFRHEGKIITPLRKGDGFYVFCGIDRPEIEIAINRPHYHRKLKRVIKTRLDPGYPVVSVRLTREYPGNFSDCQWLHGTGPPNSEVLAFWEDERLRLQSADEATSKLTIPRYVTGGLVGRRFTMSMKSGETFILTRMTAPGIYLADRKLPAPLSSGQPIIRAYRSVSGADGSYHIPIEHGAGKIQILDKK